MKYKLDSRNKKKCSWTNSWVALVIMFAILLFSFRAAWKSYNAKVMSGQAAETKNEELKKLEGRQAYLQEELRKIDTQEGREAVLREEFGVGKPDEQLAIIVEAEAEKETSAKGSQIWQSVKTFFSELFKK